MLNAELCYRAVLAKDARFDGRFFVAVRTTGIYCRPICWARKPKRENIDFYPTAAAAQAAGYRPCLRCRPECSPGTAAWRGTFNTVSRALALIESGVLDGADVALLAERLGVGERHLRRLFDQHLGASPVAVAQTRRVLMAKQLIHETTLSMTEVAQSAGFGSVRRFNEVFRRLFGRPPSALRRDRSGAKGRQAGSGIMLTLAYRPPFQWDSLLAFLAGRAAEGVERVEGRLYARTFSLDGSPGHLLVRPSAGHQLEATIHVSRVSSIPEIVRRLRRLFDLDADPRVIGARLGQDPLLRPIVSARPGLRVPGAFDAFELAVRAVLGQQVTVRAATQLASRLVAAFGDSYEPPPHLPMLRRLFPTAAQLAEADIARIGMPRARAATIRAVARAFAADPGMFDPSRDPQETRARLRAIAGIGDWTAQYITMRALPDSDALPAADIGLQRALAQDGVRPSAAAIIRRAEQWRPWRSYAVLHLWNADALSSPPAGEKEIHANSYRGLSVADRHAAAGL